MERVTLNKKVEDMGMVELAHNSCYAQDRQAMYRDFEDNVTARALARHLMLSYGVWDKENFKEELEDSDSFDEALIDSMMCDVEDIQGLIALFYRNLWAQADLYETLKHYEDLSEQGKLIELPCKVGDTVYTIYSDEDTSFIEEPFIVEVSTHRIWIDSCCFDYDDIGKIVFLTKSEAEQALAERQG